jgi:hypothetical protein
MSDNQQASKPPVSRGLVFAIVIVAILLVCVLVFIVGAVARSAGGHHASPVATHTSGPTDPSSETSADKSVCGLPGFAASGTLNAAPPTKWVLVGTVAAPTERATVGPGVVKGDGFRSCYEHTPTGALFAAANYLALTSDARYAGNVLRDLLVPGHGQQAAIASEASSPQSSSLRVQLAGFAIDSYSAKAATVDLAVTNEANGEFVSIPLELQWSGGDWKLVVTSAGTVPLTATGLADLGGYTPWAGA